MSKFFLQPVSYSVTYDESDMEDYVDECEEEGITPTQAGFQGHVKRCFECMLEECLKPHDFQRTIVPEIVVFPLDSAS